MKAADFHNSVWQLTEHSRVQEQIKDVLCQGFKHQNKKRAQINKTKQGVTKENKEEGWY